MKNLIKYLFFVSLVFFVGCSGIKIINSPSPPQIKVDEGLIYFYRPSSFFGAALTHRIMQNEQIIGALNPGTYFYCSMKPGKNEFSIKVYGEPISNFELTVEPGKVYFIRVRSKPRLFSNWSILSGETRAASIDQKTAELEIAKCKLGVLEK